MSPSRQQPRTVTLFGAPRCHLCHDARELLRQLEHSGKLNVQDVNIDTSIDLQREFGLRIPVIRIDTGNELDWPFSTDDVEVALRRTAD